MTVTLLPQTTHAWANTALAAALLAVVAGTGLLGQHAPLEGPGQARAVQLDGPAPDPTFGSGPGSYLVTTVRVTTSALGDAVPLAVHAPDAIARYTRTPQGAADYAESVTAARAAALSLVDPARTPALVAEANKLTPVDHGLDGPSAGLVIALAYVDALTPGDLTGGKVIAGTGTVTAGGAVGDIGGPALKIAGAQAQHPDVFFAPTNNAAEARSAGTPTPILGVDTLSQAVAWLCAHGGTSTVCPTS